MGRLRGATPSHSTALASPPLAQMMKLTDFDETYGAICVDGQVHGLIDSARRGTCLCKRR
jgi:hypothetical protein